ncbi:MAG: hypothetical protein MZV63_67020 [Marinilabiliales bacterium]|nr:hypothetical protein [Marinilabiliales bacterium]
MDVIAVFDVGKSSKRLLLFDYGLNIVHQEEKLFAEIHDSAGVGCDDTEAIIDLDEIAPVRHVIRTGEQIRYAD